MAEQIENANTSACQPRLRHTLVPTQSRRISHANTRKLALAMLSLAFPLHAAQRAEPLRINNQ
eukprot:1880206-Lingulodinium_polyedra.AAC.1